MITFDTEAFKNKKIWISADTHFGHQGLLDRGYRPWKNADKQDNALIKNINALVAPDDLLIINGDLTMHNHERINYITKIVERINGQKVLVFGNHDKLNALKYVDIGFILAATSLILPGGILIAHDPAWAEVWPREQPVLCGHIHSLFKVCGNVVNVGIDVWDYKPVLLEDALAEIKTVRSPDIDWKTISKNRHKTDPPS